MARIIFVKHDGTRTEVEGVMGESVMKIATAHWVAGIVGDCGGCLSCATCHVFVEEPWAARLPKPSSEELSMIECTLDPRPTSRLSCQIKFDESLDGLVVTMPAAQV